jgi:FAD-dependent urate hydroxylase
MSDGSRQPVAVVGAGPYGLAASAHLRALGVPTHVFGAPLEYWRRNMPSGMRLRSSWNASSIASPGNRLSLSAFEVERGAPLERPIPLMDFIAYGEWYQQSTIPDVDTRRVTRIDRAAGGFSLTLSDDERLDVRRVVIATGLEGFIRRPTIFDGLSAGLVTHTAEFNTPGAYAGRTVVVVGAGQSAIESAVLASEAGASVHVIARAPGVHWLIRSAQLHGARAQLGRILYSPTDVGPAGLSWLVSAPSLMLRTPRGLRQRMIRRCLRPAASAWLLPRSDRVTLTFGRSVVAAAATPDRHVRLSLDDGSLITADHVLLGTGFRPDLSAVTILSPDLRRAIAQRDGQPLLRPGFETSVAGLHVLGALAADSFGPVLRFVSGTWYTAPALARHIARDRGLARRRATSRPLTATTAAPDVARPQA